MRAARRGSPAAASNKSLLHWQQLFASASRSPKKITQSNFQTKRTPEVNHGVLRRGENAPVALAFNYPVYPIFPDYVVKSDRRIGISITNAIGRPIGKTTLFSTKGKSNSIFRQTQE